MIQCKNTDPSNMMNKVVFIPNSMCFTEMVLSSLAFRELLHPDIQSKIETSAKSLGLTATINMNMWAAYWSDSSRWDWVNFTCCRISHGGQASLWSWGSAMAGTLHLPRTCSAKSLFHFTERKGRHPRIGKERSDWKIDWCGNCRWSWMEQLNRTGKWGSSGSGIATRSAKRL